MPESIADVELADALTGWLRSAPRELLVHLADSESRDEAARALGERIAEAMTMAFPAWVESSAPTLPF